MTIKLDTIAQEVIPKTALEKIQRKSSYEMRVRFHYQAHATRDRLKEKRMISTGVNQVMGYE